MTEVIWQDVTIAKDGKNVVSHAALSFKKGELVALVGHNGAGKSSLLESVFISSSLHSGKILIDGEDTQTMQNISRAKKLSYLPQSRPLSWPLRVKDVVALGRFAWGTSIDKINPADQLIINESMEACNLIPFANQRTDHLSGGELARVHIARALAAKTPLLIADEPITELDPKHQIKIMSLLQQYVAAGHGALITLHDLSMAARYANRMVWMKNGSIIDDGSPQKTLTQKNIQSVFDMSADIYWEKESPIVIYKENI